MQKNIMFKLSIICFLVITLCGCSEDSQTYKLSKEHMLEMVQYYSNHHLQSVREIEIFRTNNVRSVTIIEEKVEDSSLDSLTFLRINEDGKILTKTTNECTTLGCLPFTILQSYEYSDGKIVKMNDYTFKHKYKSRAEYWNMIDTLKLSLFDWEDYSYVGDTLIIESATQKWTITSDEKNRISSWEAIIKMNKQTAKITYQYKSNSIAKYLINTLMKEPVLYTIKVVDYNKVESIKSSIADRKKVYVFNRLGLIEQINSYINNNLVSRLKFTYDKRI